MKLVFVVLAFALLFGSALAGREAITEVALEECSTCQIVSQAIIDFLSINGVDKIVQKDLDIICSKIPGTIQGKVNRKWNYELGSGFADHNSEF
jgi:hypothetical protein